MQDLKLLLTFIQSGNRLPGLSQQAVQPRFFSHCHSLGSQDSYTPTILNLIFIVPSFPPLLKNHPAPLTLQEISQVLCKRHRVKNVEQAGVLLK